MSIKITTTWHVSCLSIQGFPGGDGEYHEVPDKAVIPENQRPLIPFALACWRAADFMVAGGFLCFTPPAVVENKPNNHNLFSKNAVKTHPMPDKDITPKFGAEKRFADRIREIPQDVLHVQPAAIPTRKSGPLRG